VAKARPQSAAGGTVGGKGGPGMAAIFGPGGPLSRGDCPQRDSKTTLHYVIQKDGACDLVLPPLKQVVWQFSVEALQCISRDW